MAVYKYYMTDTYRVGIIDIVNLIEKQYVSQ